MYKIDKSFEFCYGHRVYNQELDPVLSMNSSCACRRLHGHQGKIVVHLQADHLENGMVTDFVNLKWFKHFIDETIDHKFIIGASDPLFGQMIDINETGLRVLTIPNTNVKVGHSVSYEGKDPDLKEYYDSFVVVPFPPTSEHLSKWAFDLIKTRMPMVNNVEWWETPKSRSTYIGDIA